MRLTLTALIVSGGLALSVTPSASASAAAGLGLGSDPAVTCSTIERGRRLVTRIERVTGWTDRISDLLVVERAFPGTREVVKPVRRPGNRVSRCRVTADGTVVLRTTGGARVDVYQPLLPTSSHPTAAGAWLGPVSFHSTVSADWQVAEAVAAWNASMPVDRQLTLQAEPCAVDSCISITSAPSLSNPLWLGEAYPSAEAGAVNRCSIRVADFVAAEDRSAVMAHEIGHCLGLPHWDFKGSIMFTYVQTAWTDLPSHYDLEWLSPSAD